MIDRSHGVVMAYMALFAGLALLSLFLRMLPINTMQSIPGPDFLLALAFAWVLRRPDYLPALLVAAVFLTEDLLLMRPPGLWALMVLLATEFLRSRGALTRELTFPVEWAMVSAAMVAIFIGNRLVLALLLVPQVPLGLSLLQLFLTIVAYPLVVLVSHFLLRVRKPATGEVDSLGRKL